MQVNGEEESLKKKPQLFLNFSNVRMLVREVVGRMLNYSSSTIASVPRGVASTSDASTTSNQDRIILEQLFRKDKSQQNLKRLQYKKEEMEKESERSREEVVKKGFRNFDIVAMHRKHVGDSVVFASSSSSIEMNRTSAASTGNYTTSCQSTLIIWLLKLFFSLLSKVNVV